MAELSKLAATVLFAASAAGCGSLPDVPSKKSAEDSRLAASRAALEDLEKDLLNQQIMIRKCVKDIAGGKKVRGEAYVEKRPDGSVTVRLKQLVDFSKTVRLEGEIGGSPDATMITTIRGFDRPLLKGELKTALAWTPELGNQRDLLLLQREINAAILYGCDTAVTPPIGMITEVDQLLKKHKKGAKKANKR